MIMKCEISGQAVVKRWGLGLFLKSGRAEMIEITVEYLLYPIIFNCRCNNVLYIRGCDDGDEEGEMKE